MPNELDTSLFSAIDADVGPSNVGARLGGARTAVVSALVADAAPNVSV